MNSFAALHSEYRSPKDAIRFSVDDNFHEAGCFVALDGAGHARHWIRADFQLAAAGARFLLRHAYASELWIGEKRIRNVAIHSREILALDEIAVNDLVVVVGNVRERRTAFHVAERPDSRDAGLKLFVHFDVAARIERNSGFFNSEIVGVRDAAGGGEKVRAAKGLRTGCWLDGEGNFTVLLFDFL